MHNKKRLKLQLTNGYYTRFDQISRILQYTLEQIHRKSIPRSKLVDVLGISLKQFENLSSICVGLGIIKPRTFVLTPMGKLIAEKDIFFDNMATLWIMHYVISSEPKWVVWNRLINYVIYENHEISTDIAQPYFDDLSASFSEQAINKKLPKEVLSVLDAYSEQKFAQLHLIKKVSIGKYKRGNVEMIDPLPFLYCLIHFKDKIYPYSTALIIDDILKTENSPGRVLYLEDYSVRNLLTSLHDQSLIRIETVGDLEQIRFYDDIAKDGVQKSIYEAVE